jgi:hypothetical protein
MLFTLFLAVFLLFHFSLKPRPEDPLLYAQLLAESQDLRTKTALEKQPASQTRIHVQKEIWTPDGDERPHFRLTSDASHLTIRQTKGKIEAIEQLSSLTCSIQEELNPVGPSQELRTFTAPSGLYTFPAHQFTASNASVSFYRLPTLELPDTLASYTPYLTGRVRSLFLDASQRRAAFRAEHLTAHYQLP